MTLASQASAGDHGSATVFAGCPDGDIATGGGAGGVSLSAGSLNSLDSIPVHTNDSNERPIAWFATASSTDPEATVHINLWVVCVPLG